MVTMGVGALLGAVAEGLVVTGIAGVVTVTGVTMGVVVFTGI